MTSGEIQIGNNIAGGFETFFRRADIQFGLGVSGDIPDILRQIIQRPERYPPLLGLTVPDMAKVNDPADPVIVSIILRCLTECSQIIQAGSRVAPFPGLLQSRQKYGRKNGDNGNNDQKFNQRER